MGFTAAKAPVTAEAAQPIPVTRDMIGCPLAILTTESPSTTRSTAPLTDTTHRHARDKALASSRTSSGSWMLSTPRVPFPERNRARISEALPRMMAGRMALTRARAVAVRYSVAPAPTGSSTIGMPRSSARSAAMYMALTHSLLRVPMLITRAEAMPTISAASSSAWAITGEAPMASSAFAVLFMTT